MCIKDIVIYILFKGLGNHGKVMAALIKTMHVGWNHSRISG